MDIDQTTYTRGLNFPLIWRGYELSMAQLDSLQNMYDDLVGIVQSKKIIYWDLYLMVMNMRWEIPDSGRLDPMVTKGDRLLVIKRQNHDISNMIDLKHATDLEPDVSNWVKQLMKRVCFILHRVQ